MTFRTNIGKKNSRERRLLAVAMEAGDVIYSGMYKSGCLKTQQENGNICYETDVLISDKNKKNHVDSDD